MESDLADDTVSDHIEEEQPPPSYYASLNSHAKTNTRAIPSSIYERERPPSTNWFVHSSTDPSTWQLLASGSLMSNVTVSSRDSPSHKRRYRILYPSCKYEDVYLHRPLWTSQATAFPLHHTEVYSGLSRYSAEPIVILGSLEGGERTALAAETKALASLHIPRVVAAVERQIAAMTRQATFAEMEYFSWDWACKTAAAKHDMRTMILRAKEECVKSVGLVAGLEEYLVYVSSARQEDVLASLRRSCEEVRRGLERLQL